MGYKESLYFTVPKLLVIKDIRLGVINQIFKIIIWLYVLANFFYFELHYNVETPSGYITSMWAETGDLYEKQREYIHLINNTNNQDLQNKNKNLLLEKYGFCDNMEHNYIYSLPYWDYRNVSCINLPYSEIYEKGEQEFFFMTMFTENSINLLDCEHPEYMNALDKYNQEINIIEENVVINNNFGGNLIEVNQTHKTGVLNSLVKPIFQFNDIECKITDRLDGNCICQDFMNFYTIGEEEMYFVFDYKYVTTFQKGGNYADHASLGVKTRIYNYNDELVKTFNENENIKFKVNDWIEMANLDLNDYNYATKISDEGEHVLNVYHPKFRMTGIEIIIKINCNNLITETGEDYGDTYCDIKPTINEGWASKGSSIFYLEYPDLKEEFVKSVYKDRYRYGIKFKFYINGKIGKFSFNNMINTLIAGIVLIGTGASIIVLIISNFCCNYTKTIADESSEEANRIEFLSCDRLSAIIKNKTRRRSAIINNDDIVENNENDDDIVENNENDNGENQPKTDNNTMITII